MCTAAPRGYVCIYGEMPLMPSELHILSAPLLFESTASVCRSAHTKSRLHASLHTVFITKHSSLLMRKKEELNLHGEVVTRAAWRGGHQRWSPELHGERAAWRGGHQLEGCMKNSIATFLLFWLRLAVQVITSGSSCSSDSSRHNLCFMYAVHVWHNNYVVHWCT